MKSLNPYTGLLLAGSLAFLAACGSTPTPTPVDSDRDYGPDVAPDLSHLQEPVPSDLPRSRYGNPETYEVFGQTYRVMASMPDTHVEEGVASWYGKKFHGRRTSSGETYDMYAFTAAHRELPIPVYARVTHLENDRSVVVRVNDRGPFAHNRMIDLSYAAAQRLDMVDKGTAPVRIEILTGITEDTQANAGNAAARPMPTSTAAPAGASTAAAVATTGGARMPGAVAEETAAGSSTRSTQPSSASQAATSARYYLQVGAFSERSNANNLQRTLTEAGLGPVEINDNSGGPALYRVRVGPMNNSQDLESLNQQLRQRGLEGTRVVINP